MHEKVIIIDFGGQYAHLIASRIRRERVYTEIYEPEAVTATIVKDPLVKGIVLSGGPQSVFDPDSPKCDSVVFEADKPVLGICYGHQFMAQTLGGTIAPGKTGEFGRALVTHDGACPLFKNVPQQAIFWMNHVDEVAVLPKSFRSCASTEFCRHAATWDPQRNLFSVQFHLEVTHSEYGGQVFRSFLDLCGVSRDWTLEKFLEEETKKLRKTVGDRNVFLFVSGGVDSGVAFAFLSKIFGTERVRGLFVDTGLLRKDEVFFVEKSLRTAGTDVTVLREGARFLKALENVFEPEQKREIIGRTFVEVQHDFFTAHDLHGTWILGQGTIYPDTIETGGTKHASKIKTHHNRAPEVQALIKEGKVIEPLAELYKDEVRALGEMLGLPKAMVWRHPFPGPGLGVRILCNAENVSLTVQKAMLPDGEGFVLPIKSVGVQGDFRTYKHPAVLRLSKSLSEYALEEIEKIATHTINKNPSINRCVVCVAFQDAAETTTFAVRQATITADRVCTLARADEVVNILLREMGLYDSVWQFPVVLIPVSFNGKGTESIVLRPVDSIDAMSARVGRLPWEFFTKVASVILQDPKISAVFLDVTSKPPGTIEWE